MVKTEDLGKKFEKAICLTYDIPYNGPYKYADDLHVSVYTRLHKLKELFPICKHTSDKHSRYDFTSELDNLLLKSFVLN